MLDLSLRPLKDRVFDPLCAGVPAFISPLHVTIVAFVSGLFCCVSATQGKIFTSLTCWLLNRALDCLDGALARRRHRTSDLGGFLDLLGDFIIYSLIPISCTLSGAGLSYSPSPAEAAYDGLWLSVALLESSFHVNNFVLFYLAAVIEKRKASGDEKGLKDITSVAMRPALIEGFESGLIFTAMLAWPRYTEMLSWTMTTLVSIGIAQRVLWAVPVLR